MARRRPGALRVTRHPFLWGIALFSVGHLATVPTRASLLLFGTLLVVALTGTVSIDANGGPAGSTLDTLRDNDLQHPFCSDPGWSPAAAAS